MHEGMYSVQLRHKGLKGHPKTRNYTKYNFQATSEKKSHMLSVLVSDTPKKARLLLCGYLDASTCLQFEQTVKSICLPVQKKLIIDCRQLQSINSAGLSLFMRIIKQLKVAIIFANVPKHIQSLLDLSGLSQFLILEQNTPIQ